ncbi:Flp pilus assembly protein CpaB [Salinibacillus xinjiangensis]|uniref:Flp pilus assembly protein CpaB n=1 Tax=Salinibacillus xinjiangensis TaxID=1229268 RepID=A0A6G1X495_9BACI|nr:Flp pilus assembly protein CpaB [Salinibacillus xinjiangensis]MRG85811.1 Flp pilus assembly protein CpaB [Salinibacillus xinjiangensis]
MKSLKKMWMISIILGLVLSTLLYVVLNQPSTTPATNPNEITTENEEQSETSGSTESKTENETENNMKEELESIEKEETGFTIEKGKRAISIPVNELQSVSGHVQKGDFVDVVAVVPAPKGQEPNAQILLQKLRVLAVGKQAPVNQEEGETETNVSYQLITLEVLPQEGAALAYATDQGYYTLMLRDQEDKEDSPHIHVTMDKLNKGVIPK